MLINARNRSVAVEGERIVDEDGGFDVVLDCPDLEIRPGLVNAHDHLHRNHYGRFGVGTYPNAYRWAEDIQVRYRRRIATGRRMPRRAALLTGAWKNLAAGVTTVVHHDVWEPDFDRDFPIRVARIASADSLGMAQRIEMPADRPLCLHVAEGVDGIAAGEVAELDRRGLLRGQLVAVHGVGIDATGEERFKRSGAALVWCPTSNHFLFERTTPASLLEGDVDVLIGSDSRLTGAGDLLDEIGAARTYGILDDQRLSDAVGLTCARRLGLPQPSLEPGSNADLILLGRPLTQARAADIALTVVAGVPRVADGEIARRLGPLTEQGARMRVGRAVRWINQRGIAA